MGAECVFFCQAEDGRRDAQESRGLGDVYKRQAWLFDTSFNNPALIIIGIWIWTGFCMVVLSAALKLSLIHI